MKSFKRRVVELTSDDYVDYVASQNRKYSRRKDFGDPNMSAMCSNENCRFLKSYYVDQDLLVAKKHLYTAAAVCDWWLNRRNKSYSGSYYWGTSTHLRVGPDRKLLAILFSDNSVLLERFIKWPYDSMYSGRAVIGPVLVVKALLGRNRNLAREELNKYQADLGAEENDNYFIGDIPILESMMDGDIEKFIESIQPLLDVRFLKRRRSFDHKIMELLAVEAAYFIKAMWILGHEVVIDHPLIPMDLMPIQPLEEYPVPYFFLDGYKGELPENYVKWLAMTPEERESQSQDSMKEQKLPPFDPSTYSTPAEQRMIQAVLSKGLIVKGDKDSGWKIYKDI